MSKKAYPLLDSNNVMLGYILIDLSKFHDRVIALPEKMTVPINEQAIPSETGYITYAEIFAREFYTGMELVDRGVFLKLIKPIRDGIYNPYKIYGFFPLLEKKIR